MEIISKYLEDNRFIQWVFNPNQELEDWWETFEIGHPKEKRNIQLARNILLNLRTTDRNLSEEEKIVLFSNILRQISAKQAGKKKVSLITTAFKYAAVAILFFSFGAILFYQKDNFTSQFNSQIATKPVAEDEAKLFRSNGESILLEEKNSVIEYNADGNIIVNNNVIKATQPVQKGIPELHQLVIPFGKTSEIILPDGTKVFLNAGSRLVFPEFFVDKKREVFLVGEAFFEVKEDKAHPFIVQTSDIRIKVLGTKFNVSAYPSDNIIETVLTVGKVRLEQNNSGIFDLAMELEPGQLATYNKTSSETLIKEVSTDNYVLWKDGLYKFDHSDLNRVIKKLERYYNIRFNYSDPMLGIIKISGKLDLNETREEIIRRLSLAASVKIIKKGECIYEINK
ncbi:MAG: FecR domain-containing protein [Bacteroidetes bacterium]|nr:FecR domain-containing protein [Bacteroidota bacterium]